MRHCDLESCDRRHNAKGLCFMHRARWLRGDRDERLERPIGTGSKAGRPYGFTLVDSSPTERPSLKDIHWLAGLLEGEGSFMKGQKQTSATVSASMTDYGPLEKVRKFFGGKLYGPYHSGKANEKEYWMWQARGPRAMGIAQTLYPLLSLRRQEAIKTMMKNTIRKEA